MAGQCCSSHRGWLVGGIIGSSHKWVIIYIYIHIYIYVSHTLAHIRFRTRSPVFVDSSYRSFSHTVIIVITPPSVHYHQYRHTTVVRSLTYTPPVAPRLISPVHIVSCLFCLFSVLSFASMPTFAGRTVKPAPWERVTGPRCEHRFPTSHYHQCRSWSVTTCELCDRAVRPITRMPSVRSTDSIAVHAHIPS